MKRYLGLALALVAGTSGLGAHAGTPHTSTARATAVARWTAHRARLAERLPLDAVFQAPVKVSKQAAGLSFGDDEAVLFRAGDLDKDGANDLVDARYHRTFSTTAMTEALRLEAHRGRTGALLWTVALPAATYSYAMAAPVGATGAAGVVAVQYTETTHDTDEGSAGTVTLTVTAIDNAGKQAWQRVFAGTDSSTAAHDADTYPYVGGLFDGTAGGGTEVLVVNGPEGSAYAEVAEPGGQVAQLVVIDGATGVPRPFGPAIPSTSSLDAAPVGDLNGDRAADVVAVHVTGTTVQAVALSGATGAPLWAVAQLPARLYSSVKALGDVTGDGVADVALRHSPVPADPTAEFTAESVSLLDGKTGALRWTRPGGYVYPLGNLDGAAGQEVAVVKVLDDGGIGLQVTAYDAAAHVRWDKRRVLRGSGNSEWYVGFGPVGDLDADGVVDIGYAMLLLARSGFQYEGGTFMGRTGRVLIDPSPDVWPALVPIDGHGDDAYSRISNGDVLTVTAWRGDSPRKLWQTSFMTPAHPVHSVAFYADGDRCGDLAVSARYNDTTVDYVLSGANGAPLWAVVRTGDGKPSVGKPVARSRTRYVHTC